MNKVFWLTCVLLAAFCGSAQADTLVARVDGGEGRAPGYSLGVTLPEGFEFWSFGNGAEVAVGYLPTVYRSKHLQVIAGAFAAVRSDSDEYFAVPWVTLIGQKGRTWTLFEAAGYLPLKGGATALYVNEAFLGYKLFGDRAKLGIGSGFYKESDYLKRFPVGPEARLQLDKRTNLNIRYLFGEEGDTFRMELRRGF